MAWSRPRVALEALYTQVHRRFGFNARYFVTSSFWVLLNQGLGATVGLALTVVFTRLATKDFYGQYQYLIAFVSLCSIFSLPGLNLSVIKAVVRGEDGALRRAVRLSFLGSLLAVPIFLVLSLYYRVQGDIEFSYIFIVIALLFPTACATNTWRAYYEGRKNFRAISLRAVLHNAVTAAVLIALLYWKPALVALVGAYLLLQVIFNGLYYWLVVRQLPDDDRDLDIGLGVKVTLQKFSYTAASSFPAIVIGHVYNFEMVAVYSIAVYILTFVNSLVMPIVSIYLPQLFAVTRLGRRWGHVVWATSVAGGVMLAIFLVAVRLAFHLLYGAAYHESYLILLYAAAAVFFFPLSGFLLQYLTTRGESIFVSVAHLGMNGLGLVVVLLCKPLLPFPAVAAIYYLIITILILFPMLGRLFVLERRGEVAHQE